MQKLLDAYLEEAVVKMEAFINGKVELNKEERSRCLRQIYKCIHGVSEIVPPCEVGLNQKGPISTMFRNTLQWMDKLKLHFRNGPVRSTILNLAHQIQKHLFQNHPDDTDSLNCLTTLYDTIFMSFGLDEDELSDHMEDFKTIKLHRMDKLVKSKRHLSCIHRERTEIQYELHLWVKTMVGEDVLPEDALDDIFELATSHYQDVRSYSQTLLHKILGRTDKTVQDYIVDKLVVLLKSDPSITHQMFKGALFIINNERMAFFYDWDNVLKLFPAVIQASHSDKSSIAELLKDFNVITDRNFADYLLYQKPVRDAHVTPTLRKAIGLGARDAMETDDSLDDTGVNKDFLKLEHELNRMISSNMHWRHEQIAYGILFSTMGHDRYPSMETVATWLLALTHYEENIRMMAFQSLEIILNIAKPKRLKVPATDKLIEEKKPFVPGSREANEWLQYKKMSDSELAEYWAKPFSNKGHLGYHRYPKPLLLKVADTKPMPEHRYRRIFAQFLHDPVLLKKIMELNTVEQKKDEDKFMMDRAIFFKAVTAAFGYDFIKVFIPYMERYVESTQESQQRVAAELFLGLIRGSKYWEYSKANTLRNQLEPLLRKALGHITTESLKDWEICIASVTNKIDSNRVPMGLRNVHGRVYNAMSGKLQGIPDSQAAYQSHHVELESQRT